MWLVKLDLNPIKTPRFLTFLTHFYSSGIKLSNNFISFLAVAKYNDFDLVFIQLKGIYLL